MSGHTPGPWKLADALPRAIVQDNGAEGEFEENLLWLDSEGYPVVGKIEDARLMAAAPMMLDTLKDIARYLGNRIMRSDGEELILSRCREAIAKAEGRLG